MLQWYAFFLCRSRKKREVLSIEHNRKVCSLGAASCYSLKNTDYIQYRYPQPRSLRPPTGLELSQFLAPTPRVEAYFPPSAGVVPAALLRRSVGSSAPLCRRASGRCALGFRVVQPCSRAPVVAARRWSGLRCLSFPVVGFPWIGEGFQVLLLYNGQLLYLTIRHFSGTYRRLTGHFSGSRHPTSGTFRAPIGQYSGTHQAVFGHLSGNIRASLPTANNEVTPYISLFSAQRKAPVDDHSRSGCAYRIKKNPERLRRAVFFDTIP